MKQAGNAAIAKIARGMAGQNRTRNTFAVLAVVLTTFLISTVFSLGLNYMENMELSGIRMAGLQSQAVLSAPSPAQLEQLASLGYIKSEGTQVMAGAIIHQDGQGREQGIPLSYLDAAGWEEHVKPALSGIRGSYPTAAEEVMLSEATLKLLGVSSPRVGMEVSLPVQGAEGAAVKRMRLSGFFRAYTQAQQGYVSKAYADAVGARLSTDGMALLTVNNPKKDLLRLQKDVTLRAGQVLETPRGMGGSGSGMVVPVALLVLFIVGSGYLLIYNVMYISVARDTRFYGLIKAIGTAPSQLRRLVRRQAARFALIGIPIGVALSALTSLFLVPMVLESGFMSGKSSMEAVVRFHPAVFLLSILFSAVTVWLSCRVPAKTAANFSPVEALGYQGFQSSRVKSRASRHGGNPLAMAFHNVFRDKKRAGITFLSLFLGTVTVLGVNGILGSMKGEDYVKQYQDYHFSYVNRAMEEGKGGAEPTEQFPAAFLESLKRLDGVGGMEVVRGTWVSFSAQPEDMRQVLGGLWKETSQSSGATEEAFLKPYQEAAGQGQYGAWAVTMQESYLRAYNKAHPEQPVDIDAFLRGDTALIGFQGSPASQATQLKMTAPGGGEQVFACAGAFPSTLYTARQIPGLRYPYTQPMDCVFVSEAGMKKLTGQPVVFKIGLNAKSAGDMQELYTGLTELNKTLTGDGWNFENTRDVLNSWESMMFSLKVLGNGAAVLLLVIGLMNFVNVMLTSVLARRRELAMLESVGMTKRQIRRMLTAEGGLYAGISAALILTLGGGFLYWCSTAVKALADYARFHYPAALVCGLIAAIFLICLTVPAIVYRLVSSEPVTQRLHGLDA